MIVKVCGITNLDDALAAAEAGANALGFNFHLASPRYVTTARAASIMEAVPAGVLKVGVFVDQAAPVPGLDVAQLYGLASWNGRFWRTARASAGFDADALPSDAEEAWLVDAPHQMLHGGTGSTFDWRLARSTKHRIIVAGGLDADNVRQAIEAAQPWGVDACSRLERSPGLKDHARMRAFIQAALG